MARRGDGLKKRCGCARSRWRSALHPWHFAFHYKRAERTTRTGGRSAEHRISLHVYSDKPPTYHMSHSEAKALADVIRTKIRAGTFGQPESAENGPPSVEPPTGSDVPNDGLTDPVSSLTFGDLCDMYLRDYARLPTRRPRAIKQFEYYIAIARNAAVPGPNGSTLRLEQKSADAVTRADLKTICDSRLTMARSVREQRERALADGQKPRGRVLEKAGHVGVNRLLARVRHLFNWAIDEGHVDRTPFRREGVNVVKMNRAAERARDRRLAGDEEARLLVAAGAHLHA